MQAFKNFIIKELVFTGSIGLISFLLFQSVLSEFYIPIYWLLLALIAILTGLLHFSLVQTNEKNTAKFATKFMAMSGIKMMIYLALITSYVFIFPSTAKVFLISFILLYILYTAFEVFHIIKYLKKK